MLRSALRTLADEAQWVRTEFALWCSEQGASSRRVREAILAYVNDRIDSEKRGSRLRRQMAIIKFCDMEGWSPKTAAATIGLSRAQFYRERRVAIAHLVVEIHRAMGDSASRLHEGTLAELLELYRVLKDAGCLTQNRVIASLVARTWSAISSRHDDEATIAF